MLLIAWTLTEIAKETKTNMSHLVHLEGQKVPDASLYEGF